MIYNIGEYIRNRRKELGITQDELANGICSAMTISRIERGEQSPQDFILKSVLQRLGLSGSDILFATTGSELICNQLKFDIRQTYFLEDFKKAEKILSDNKNLISKLSQTDKQTFKTIYILLKINRNELSDEEALNQLEATIRLTCPKYTKNNPPQLLTYEEILLLNNIAIQYAHLNDLDTAINLLYHIKSFYDRQVCDIEETLRTKPMVLYNLSKYLGQLEKYSECISVCEEGIELATKTGRSSCLAQTYYNISWSLYHRNKPGDLESSLYYMKLAYYSACTMNKQATIEKYAKVILNRYNIKVELL